MGLDRTAEALLIARSDAPGGAAAHEIALMEIGLPARTAPARCSPPTTRTRARRSPPPGGPRSRRWSAAASLLLEDVGVAAARPAGAGRAASRRSPSQHQVDIAVVAHAGDGNTHPLVVYDAADPDATRARLRRLRRRSWIWRIELGGTITGEHGVGRLKKAWLPAYLGPDVMALTRRIKDALDPDGILNPGAVL